MRPEEIKFSYESRIFMFSSSSNIMPGSPPEAPPGSDAPP